MSNGPRHKQNVVQLIAQAAHMMSITSPGDIVDEHSSLEATVNR